MIAAERHGVKFYSNLPVHTTAHIADKYLDAMAQLFGLDRDFEYLNLLNTIGPGAADLLRAKLEAMP